MTKEPYRDNTSPPQDGERIVTVVIAIECRVEGDAPLREVGLGVIEEPSATGIVTEDGTRIFPRAFGLIEATEKYVSSRNRATQ